MAKIHRAGMVKVTTSNTDDAESLWPGKRGTMPITRPVQWVPMDEEPEPERPPANVLGKRKAALERGVAMKKHGLSLAEPPPELVNEIVPARRLQWILEETIKAARKKISVIDATRINAICEHTARVAMIAKLIRDNYKSLSPAQYSYELEAIGKAVTQRESLVVKLFDGLDLNESQGDQLSAAIRSVDDNATTPDKPYEEPEGIESSMD